MVADIDHPDIEKYIDWKANEEQKVAALVSGSKATSTISLALEATQVAVEGNGWDPKDNKALRAAIRARKAYVVPYTFSAFYNSQSRASLGWNLPSTT